jgi:hypothetical protein
VLCALIAGYDPSHGLVNLHLPKSVHHAITMECGSNGLPNARAAPKAAGSRYGLDNMVTLPYPACLQYGSRLTTVKATRLSVLMAFESSIVGLEIPTSGADRATVT